MSGYEAGTRVEWNWGNGTGEGKIVKVYTQKITRTIKGSDVTRKANDDEPAYFIEQEVRKA